MNTLLFVAQSNLSPSATGITAPTATLMAALLVFLTTVLIHWRNGVREREKRQEEQRLKIVAELRAAHAVFASAMHKHASALGIFGHASDILRRTKKASTDFISGKAPQAPARAGVSEKEYVENLAAGIEYFSKERAKWEENCYDTHGQLLSAYYALSLLERDPRRLAALEEFFNRLLIVKELTAIKKEIARETDFALVLHPAIAPFDDFVKNVAKELEDIHAGRPVVEVARMPEPTYDFPEDWHTVGIYYCHVNDQGKAKHPPSAAKPPPQ